MAFKLPNGSIVEIGSAFAAPTPTTAVSNANPAVVSAPGHDLEAGNVLVVGSGWTRLDGKVVRVITPTADAFSMEGINTTNLNVYTAGSGAGNVRAVTDWVQITQITDPSTSGGDQQFTTFGFLEDDDDRQLPTSKSPITLTLPVADDPAQAYVPVCEAADEDKEPRVVRLKLPNSSVIYYYAYVSITATPTLARNSIMTRTITLSLASRPTRYQAA